MEEKLRDYFEEMVVYKDLKNNTGFFSSLGLPAFLRDYLLKTFSDEYGRFNMEEVLNHDTIEFDMVEYITLPLEDDTAQYNRKRAIRERKRSRCSR